MDNQIDYTQHEAILVESRYNDSPAKSRKKASGLVEKYRNNINKNKK